MNQEIENHIRNNTMWNKLPQNVKQLVGNSQKEYEKAIVSYCIKNQARFKDTLVRYVRKDEKKYYEDLLKYSKDMYMLYPYHLSDIFVRGLRITPFNYYLDMMANLMESEKSYDTLPNFTAIDCLRLLGIGRNQYIDLINKYRSSSNNRFRAIGLSGLAKRKPVRTLLPTQPISIPIEPWWVLNVGCVTDEDVRILSQQEKNAIDLLIDNEKPTEAGQLNYECVHLLYKKGLVYVDVPLNENDKVELPPLEGFVMNRTTGDYFETLLYKLFVSIDERTTLGELASLLQIDIDLVINAVSVYCRLAFGKKKLDPTSNATSKYDSSWNDYLKHGHVKHKNSLKDVTLLSDLVDVDKPKANGAGAVVKSDTVESMSPSLASLDSNQTNSNLNQKRIGFLFDSTLTAFLMMGNLSLGLKNHAVTMFEVGKLNDQMLDSFLAELDKVEEDKLSNEGEAQRYFDHAIILNSTIKFLRNNKELTIFSGFRKSNAEDGSKEEDEQSPIEDEPLGLDLLRVESLATLDDQSRQRLLAKNYSILISMSPYNTTGDSINSPPITSDAPYHIGPAVPEMNSVWFRLFLYDLIQDGPPSLLIPKGYRLVHLPSVFKHYDRFMILTWGHDPLQASHSNLLISINEINCHGPVLVQGHAESEQHVPVVYVAFNDTASPFYNHPTVLALHDKLCLKHYVGYISLAKPYKSDSNDHDHSSDLCYDDWIFTDLRFGIPLFDKKLNSQILHLFHHNKLGSVANLKKMLECNRTLTLKFIDFVQRYQTINIMDDPNLYKKHDRSSIDERYIVKKLYNMNAQKKSCLTNMIIHPTQCVLFDQGKINIYQDN